MRPLHVEELNQRPVEDLEVEIVERKGPGHPDSLIDGASEAVSKALCRFYLKEFGSILHHNVDKGILVGGRSNPCFGGGEVLEPIYMLVAGRATSYVLQENQMKSVPIGGIAVSAIKTHLKSTMRFLDTENHVLVDYKIKQGSSDLISVFDRAKTIPVSNDTSIGVGYAPLSPTERLVLETERLMNSQKFKSELPEVGEDIKVMALRRGKDVQLTVAAAMVSTLIKDPSHYASVIEGSVRRVEDMASRLVDGMDVTMRLNQGDDPKRGAYYLTVTGTSAESGDDGNTGRGNRGNGLIAPMREYSMEATAGKNPVNHTGKIFNALAQKAAERIYKEVEGIRGNYVRLLSRIGNPIDIPQIASAAVILDEKASFASIRGVIQAILDDELSRVTSITDMILNDGLRLF